MKKLLLIIPVLLIAGIFFYACQDTNVVEPTNNPGRLNSSVLPTLVNPWTSGNAETECSNAGNCGINSYKVDQWDQDNGMDDIYEDVITIYDSDGKTFSWSSTYKVCQVIVKAGTGAYIYTYEGGSCGDQGLVAPENKEISHVTFCWTDVRCEEKCYEYQCETAFGGNSAGPTTTKNKAWWFYYDVSVGGEQTIWAGQNMNAGTVEYDNGYIVISLADGWSLKDYYFEKDLYGKEICGEFTDVPYTEAVKIQGYNTLPLSKPTPGLFTIYEGMDLTVPVSDYLYYVIHLDLVYKYEVTCE